jgi:hypothetical protein
MPAKELLPNIGQSQITTIMALRSALWLNDGLFASQLLIFIDSQTHTIFATGHYSAILVVLWEEQNFSFTSSIFGLYDCIMDQINIYSR